MKLFIILIIIFSLGLSNLKSEVFRLDSFALRPLVFAEDNTVLYGSSEQMMDYSITFWQAGVFLPFGWYKLLVFVDSLDSEGYYTETSVSLNNMFMVYNFERGGGVYLSLVPKLLVKTYGKLAETGDPAFMFKGASKGALDVGVLVKYVERIAVFFYGKNVNRPDFGVVVSDILQAEYGVKSYFKVWKVLLGLSYKERGRFSGELILNYPSFANFFVSRSKEELVYGLSLSLGRVCFGFSYTVFEFTTKPQFFLEYRM